MRLSSSLWILGAVGLLGLASCSDDDNKDVKDENRQIQFNVTVPRASRAEVTTTNTINNFRMWAFVNGNRFMDGVTVTRPLEGGNWTYSPIMYWPLEQDVNFYGISPSDITTTQDPVQGDANPDIPGFVNRAGLTDLLYSVNMKERESGRVQVNFRHALSQLQFQFRRLERDKSPIRVEVIGVDLVGTNTVGDFKYPKETTSSSSSDKVHGTWSNQTTIKTETLYDSTKVTLTKDYQVINNTGYAFVIPQDLVAGVADDTSVGAFVAVKCAIYDQNTNLKLWPAKTVPGYDDNTGSAYIYFPLRNETSNVLAWEPGKRYNYNITIGVPQTSTTIGFDVTVDEYGDFMQSDLNN